MQTFIFTVVYNGKMTQKKRGRPSTISVVVNEEALRLADGKITQVLKSKVRGTKRKAGGNNGGYIPVSSQYGDHEVLVIVLDKGVRIPSTTILRRTP